MTYFCLHTLTLTYSYLLVLNYHFFKFEGFECIKLNIIKQDYNSLVYYNL